ncbi:MAG TPA: RNA polymerase sigma factor [Gemmatimonadales bacterium]|nr:RNA polymerase sigma factor [Gemmatimonadales bacterium]
MAPPRADPAVRSDAAILTGWYEAHGPAVYRFLRFQVATPDLAEELTAETFFRACRAAARYRPERAGARSWLVAIARNVLRDHRRRARLRDHLPLPTGGLRDLVSDAPSPEERLLREEEVSRLLAAVAALPAGERELIGLRYGSGLEPQEIAAVLGLRVGTVRSRLWRTLGRLRERLGP